MNVALIRRRAGRWALNGAAAIALLYILTPLIFVVWLAFFRQEIPSFPPEGYSLHWFAAILDQPKFVDGFSLSFQVGVLATLIGLALGVPAALCVTRMQFTFKVPLASLLLMPLIVPGVVLGTAMYVFHVELENGLDVDVLGTFYALVAGHIVIVIPWVVRLVTASLAGVDRSTEEAAQNLGANAWITFWRITLPAIRPGIVAGALFGFVTSFGNLEMSLFLVGPGRTTLPIVILQYLEWKIDPTIAAVSVVQILLIAGGNADHRPLREAGAGRLRWPASTSSSWSSVTATSTPCATSRCRVADGEFLVLLGPSGCGKTTTLRMVAGFIEPTSGMVRLGGGDVTLLPPWRRNAGMVFQSYALFPHLTVAQNVAFGLEMRKLPRADIERRVEETLALVRLAGYGARLPRQLSGGQQQRVALARALAIRPDVLLLDEPLSNLDAKLRQEVRVEIRELQRQMGLTTVMVTHDQEEALTMADRLVVMNEGSVRQVGSQRDLYERPADRFVAGFVGRSTFLDGAVEAAGRFRTDGGLSLACRDGKAGRAVLSLRPERVEIGPTARAGLDNSLPGTVEFVSYLGALIDIHVRLSPADRLVVQIANREGGFAPEVGQPVHVGWPASAGLVFNE